MGVVVLCGGGCGMWFLVVVGGVGGVVFFFVGVGAGGVRSCLGVCGGGA